jgi:RNA polymerase sigma factor (sigma-70 family)
MQPARFLVNDLPGGADLFTMVRVNGQVDRRTMMAESEAVLLRRFVTGGDAGAFAEIVRRYAGLVYGTCLRVLADTEQAADATQETFFQLMKKGGEIHGSLAGWLHRVAVRKAVDVIRADSARRRREEQYVDTRAGREWTWQEAAPYVDEALDGLDGATRELLVRHYLEGRSMTELADQTGVSRPTISRQLDAGLQRLRAELQRRGALVAAAALSTFLAENTAQSAPAALLQQLGKMALMGAKVAPVAASAGSLSSVLSTGLAAVARIKLIAAAATVTVIVGAGLLTYESLSSGPREAVVPARPVAPDRRAPAARPAKTPPEQPRPATQPEEPRQKPPVEQPSVTSTSVPQPSHPAETRAEPLVVPGPQATKSDSPKLDLSSPAAAVRSFTRAFASGDAEAVMACMLPGGTDYDDIQKILNANPDDRDQRDSYQMKLWLEALAPDVEMPIVEVNEGQHGTSVTWQVTYKKDVTLAGQTFHAGDTFNLDATLRQADGSWLIDGI